MTTSALPHAAGKCNSVLSAHILTTTHITEAIALARECDVPEILPTAFYALSVQRWNHGAEGGRSHLTLSPQDLRRLIAGRESLQDMLVTLIAKPLLFQFDDGGPRTLQVCPPCHEYLSKYWVDRLMPSLSTPWGCWLVRVLQRMCGPDNDELRLSTCAGCAAKHCELARRRLVILKESIPEFFMIT